MHTRREFLAQGAAASTAALATLAGCATASKKQTAGRAPNVVLIMTDDQGYGDLGCHGNPVLRTPNIDRIHDEGVRFTHFHVCPVCSPTRSCLMTGRYNYRTGIVDTYQGRSMMHPDEVTLAEMLSKNGYQTGIFGKWHLGDCYPMRAMDQGFHESLVINGGGLCQPADPPPGNQYSDPTLRRNGVYEKCSGYCTDIYTDAAINFMEGCEGKPFFVYLPTNAPHVPTQIADEYVAPYRAAGMDEYTAKVYGMVANVDMNVGKVLAALDRLGIADNTIVVFLTDNGPHCEKDSPRYNAGMRGQKGTVYEGGIRVPCFMRWPARLQSGKDIGQVAAHIDLLPTLCEACGATPPEGVKLDGRSLLPLLSDRKPKWPDRTLFFQWHRGDVPMPYNNCAAIAQQYKLVNGTELYDLAADPGEHNDIARDKPEIAAKLRAEYDAWFEDVSNTRGYAPPRIFLGTPHENPTMLTRQDWRAANGWHEGALGYWDVNVTASAKYEIQLLFAELPAASEARFMLNGVELRQAIPSGAKSCVFPATEIPAGEGRVEAWVRREGKPVGVHYVITKRT